MKQKTIIIVILTLILGSISISKTWANDWERVWTNFGNDVMGGWTITPNDDFHIGDFDGDGLEELLCVQRGAGQNAMALLKFRRLGTSATTYWTIEWSSTSSTHPLLPYREDLIVGDYDGDGKDEILGNAPNGWTTMFRYQNNNFQWVWSDNGNASHPIRPYKDKFVAGDFNGDGKDELLGADLPNGWTTMFKFQNNNFQWMWSDNGGSSAIRSYRENLNVGDLDNDGKDEVLGLASWATVLHFENNSWQWGWSNYGGNTLGSWGYPLLSTDKMLIGDIDDTDGKEEVMFVQRGFSASWAASMDLLDNQTGWSSNWSVGGSNSKIGDWPISDVGVGNNTKYFLIKAEANKPAYFLAFRQRFGCCADEFWINLYSSKPNTNKRINPNAPKDFSATTINANERNIDQALTVSPNPSFGQFSVTMEQMTETTDAFVEVYNQTGQLVFNRTQVTNRSVQFDLSEYAAGWYVVVVKTADKVYSEKIQLLK